MLIRFQVKNLYSFKEETEFNVLPGRVKRLEHHKYEKGGLEFLKLSAIYGANGSGKSNLIRSISLLREVALTGVIPTPFFTQKFRLSDQSQNEPVELAIEFFAGQAIYYYSIAVNDGNVVDEYFSVNNEGQQDQMIFHREFTNGDTEINFVEGFEEGSENKTLKKVIKTDLLKGNQPLFTLLNTISNDAFDDVKTAYDWFSNDLKIIYPETQASGLVLSYEANREFGEFANEVMCSFNTGISNLKVEVKSLEEYFGSYDQREIEELKSELRSRPGPIIVRRNGEDEVAVVNEGGKFVTKCLLFEHQSESGKKVAFTFEEESDGTKRLLEYLPALNSIVERSPTYIIDEIERSVHPLIIKEVVDKFSKDTTTKGQLIFTTHESNLLDQEIFRTDEIWFAEKNQMGSTKVYPLSDFKEHSTIDIRKGYLNGRYGAIPFLGNLKDLNWHSFQGEEK